MEDLKRRMSELEQRTQKYIEMGSKRAREIEEKVENFYMATTERHQINERAINALEKVAETRNEQAKYNAQIIKSLADHIERMENNVLQELKNSQAILRGMIEHEASVENAKLQMKMEMEKKEQEAKDEARRVEIEARRARQELKKDLYTKLLTIGLPIITALATGITYAIEKFIK